jgi:hypothetical protein
MNAKDYRKMRRHLKRVRVMLTAILDITYEAEEDAAITAYDLARVARGSVDAVRDRLRLYKPGKELVEAT